MPAFSLPGWAGFLLFPARGWCVRPGLQPDDIVTPKQAAAILDVPVGTVWSWISRAKLEPLGKIRGYSVYDYRDIADVPARMERQREQAA